MDYILRDLKHEHSAKIRDIMMFDDDRIRELAGQFFEGSGIFAKDGSEPSEDDRFRIMKQIIAMRKRLGFLTMDRYSIGEYRDGTDCSAGRLNHYYFEEEHYTSDGCFDGGGGNYEVEYYDYYLIFSRVGTDTSWEEMKASKERADSKTAKQEENRWYYDADLEDETVPVFFNYDELYMLDPFGMKGIFKWERVIM